MRKLSALIAAAFTSLSDVPAKSSFSELKDSLGGYASVTGNVHRRGGTLNQRQRRKLHRQVPQLLRKK